MKCFVLVIIVSILAIFPSPSFCAYLIKLKTGQEFITKECWEEHGKIKFYRYGGAVGIDKRLVEHIEEVPFGTGGTTKNKEREGSKEKAPALEPGEAPPEKTAETKKPESNTADGPEPDKKESPQNHPDLEPYREAYLDLKAQYQQAKQAYWKARRAKNTEAKEKALYEMESSEKWLNDLKEKVKKKNNGVLPDWWQ